MGVSWVALAPVSSVGLLLSLSNDPLDGVTYCNDNRTRSLIFLLFFLLVSLFSVVSVTSYFFPRFITNSLCLVVYRILPNKRPPPNERPPYFMIVNYKEKLKVFREIDASSNKTSPGG